MPTLYSEEQLVRITRRIEDYRATKQRQRVERAIKLWRRADAERRVAAWLESPERRH